MDLNTPISELNRVGKTSAKRLEYLGVKNVEDLLYYFPFRYEDYRKIVPIAQLRAGELVTICGQVELIGNKRSFRSRKTITEALVSDKSGSVRVEKISGKNLCYLRDAGFGRVSRQAAKGL